MKQVTVNIFGTGNIIINGAVTLKEIAYAYKVINEYLTADIREDKADVVKTHDMFLGAKLERWVQVLKKTKLYDAYE
jgi:TATA-box binding protein (TBP) (component of TFIID and TFIIIB)